MILYTYFIFNEDMKTKQQQHKTKILSVM